MGRKYKQRTMDSRKANKKMHRKEESRVKLLRFQVRREIYFTMHGFSMSKLVMLIIIILAPLLQVQFQLLSISDVSVILL